jgi:hypothetical protein
VTFLKATNKTIKDVTQQPQQQLELQQHRADGDVAMA